MHAQERPLPQARRFDMSVIRRAGSVPSFAAVTTLALVATGCTETFDAGSQVPHGLLPVDERNPVVLLNDSSTENWQGEYAVLLANGGGPKLAGIVVGTSPNASKLEENIPGWRDLVATARASNLKDIPDPLGSTGAPLKRPTTGEIRDTTPNRSEGALFIKDVSLRLSLPYRPLVVVTGGRLTDVADAYLIDPSVADRVVVVSSLGSLSSSGGAMGDPNGEMDSWADTIVTTHFRYVQVSAFYDQLTDVPTTQLSVLPANDFCDRIRKKQPDIWALSKAADQVGIAAVGIRGFVVEVRRVSAVGPVAADATVGPALQDDPNGHVWLVRQVSGTAATTRFRQLLFDPATYAP
jgi:hypothetical protein